MTETRDSFEEFISRAIRRARKSYGAWLVEEDIRSFANERIAIYCGRRRKGEADAGLVTRLARADAGKYNRHIQQALNCDLLSYARLQVEKEQRRRAQYLQLSIQAFCDWDNSQGKWEKQIVLTRPVGDGPHTEECERLFPLMMMHHGQGMSWGQMSEALKLAKSTIRARHAREVEAFKSWAAEKGMA